MQSRNYSTGKLYLSQDQFKQPKLQIVQSMLRDKIFTYTHFRIKTNSISSTNRKKPKKRDRMISSAKVMPEFETFEEVLHFQKDIVYVYREKMESGFDQGFYCTNIKLFSSRKAVQSGFRLGMPSFAKQLIPSKSVLLPTLLLVSQTLFELGHSRLAFYFCSLVILIGQIYRDSLSIGKALLIMAKTSRKTQKFKQAIGLCKKALQYFWFQKSALSADLQIQTYSQLSYNFLQSNQYQQSKVFGQKYQIGYTQPQDSKIMTLSKQLVTSVQNRVTTWKKTKMKNFELVIKIKLTEIVQQNQQKLRGPIDQNQFLKLFNVSFYDLFHENFMKHEMFFYEIPLPLQFRRKKLSVISKRRVIDSDSSKFIPKTRAKSLASFKVLKVQNQKVQEKIILNYRGVGISKKKLYTMLEHLLQLAQLHHNQYSMNLSEKQLPLKQSNSL